MSLIGYFCCILLQTKEADEVVSVYLNNVYARFRGSRKIIIDNSSEFKNTMFVKEVKELGLKQISSTPYHPWGYSDIQVFHNFMKTCTRKYVHEKFEWTEVVLLLNVLLSLCTKIAFVLWKLSKNGPLHHNTSACTVTSVPFRVHKIMNHSTNICASDGSTL